MIEEEAEKVFKKLDDDNNGFITQEEFVKSLGISSFEAKALIEEAEKAIHGKVQDGQLTLDEFKKVMASVSEDSQRPASARAMKRYRLVFDSIDVDKNGVITAAELISGMGIEFDDDADELDFDAFVELMQKAERSRAPRTLAQLLKETDEGADLVNALSSSRRRRNQIQLENWADQPPALVKSIWAKCGPENDKAKVETIRSVLLKAFQEDLLDCNETIFLQITVKIDSLTDDNDFVSFAGFASALQENLEGDLKDSARSSKSGGDTERSGSSGGSDRYGGPGKSVNPFGGLTEIDIKLCHEAFDKFDKNKDSLLDKSEMVNVLEFLMDRGVIDEMNGNQIEYCLLEFFDEIDKEEAEFDDLVQLISDLMLK
eukprot:c27829_g1_i1.p1 GENE.c27829_g1_i1~~c27829_g1_i1.p1  ORF type:complete len:426 (+),score=229.26 c27829_g1_i1:161-1279(+)